MLGNDSALNNNSNNNNTGNNNNNNNVSSMQAHREIAEIDDEMSENTKEMLMNQ